MKSLKTRKLLVFDLDNTLVSVNTSYYYLMYLYKKNLLRFSFLFKGLFIQLRFYLTSMSLKKLHHLVFNKMLKGFSLTVLEKNVDFFLKELVPKNLYLPAYNELLEGIARGDYIALFSSAPNFLVHPFAQYFRAEFWESTVYGVDEKNCLSNIAQLVVGTDKERFLLQLQKKLNIPKERVVVYSDSHDDIPLFLQAGEAVVVNPTRKLAKFAKASNWRKI